MKRAVRTSSCGKLLVALLVALCATFIAVGGAAATNGKVIILDSTVSGGASSLEALAAVAAGHGVDVVDSTTWSGMTTAQFADYDAIILGDATCTSLGAAAAAEANASVWGAAVNGNVIIVGTDPVFHSPGVTGQNGDQLVNSGVKFAADAAGKTGAYVTLSCYYHGTAPATPVPLLDGIEAGFTVTGVGCYNDINIVATHPALTGLDNTDLENWSCSVHEAFDGFPSDFLPLVIAEDPVGGPPLPGSLSFPDGSHGVPYVMARGEGLVFISNITLSPLSATNEVGTPHTVTAHVEENGAPVVGTTVTFTVVSGPHMGLTFTVVGTNASGDAWFTYTGTTAGTDTIQASYVDSAGVTKTSNLVTKEWTKPADSEAPGAMCVQTTNPSGNNIPKAGPGAGKSGQNPDGFYQLIGTDNVAVASIVVADTGSSFVSNPFASGDKVKVTQAPGVTPSDTRPGPGVIVSHLKLKGDAILRVTDTSGNVTEAICRVAPLPK